jgi:hypothetical protein
MIQQDPEVLKKASEALTAVYSSLIHGNNHPFNKIEMDEIPEIAEIKTASDAGDLEALQDIIDRFDRNNT